MVFAVQTTAWRRLMLALVLAPTLAESLTSNSTLYQLNATIDPGFITAPGSHSVLVPQPESTVGYTEQANITANDSKLEVGTYTMDPLFYITHYCCRIFEDKMQRIGHQQWCNWTSIDRLYSSLTHCSEHILELCGSYWPSDVGEKLFIMMHARYFQNCSMEENHVLIDPPENTVLGLILAPICIIPIMVTLVVWCSKSSEANAKK
uniref:receptor activity-modifying protein 2 n=1 Tax=Pristiophorus japonicus TaxID=55135 RepID=UPI00398F3D3B